MKKGIGSLMLVALFAGMASCGKSIPDDIIQPEDMENLLYDYHLASTMTNSLSYTENYKKKAYYEYVFRKHNVTEAEFDSSMVWYTRHNDELAAIYERLQKRFEEAENYMKVQVAKRDNQIDVSLSGDTVDIWQDRTLYWLTTSPLTNKLTFGLKADTSFRVRDALLLEADFHFLPKANQVDGTAVLGLNYQFSNDSIQGITRIVRGQGPQRIYLRPDSAYEIRSVSGFIYYTNDHNPKASLLVDKIRLTRYHIKEDEKPVAKTDSTVADSVKHEAIQLHEPAADTVQKTRRGSMRNRGLHPSAEIHQIEGGLKSVKKLEK